MTNSIKLINNNITGAGGLKLLHGALTYGWKNLVSNDPGEGFYGAVESQFNGWENPTFNLLFHIPVGDATYADGTNWMSWAKWNELVKNQYLNTVDTATSLQMTVASRQEREEILGSFLSGASGSSNRTYSLHSVPVGNLTVIIDDVLQTVSTDYTVTGNVITFLDNLINTVKISITYISEASFIDYSADTSTTGTSSPKIQIKGYTLSLSPDESRGGYFWTINAQLVVTK